MARLNKHHQFILTESEKNILIEKYNKGVSYKDLNKEFQTSQPTLDKFLKTNGIPLREEPRKKYKVNHTYFDNIDCQEKAYILGFWFADGNVSQKRKHISIALAEQDKEILEKITNFIQPGKPLNFSNLKIKNPNWQNTYKLTICSEYIKNRFIEIGCIPKKTLILEFPTLIPDEFIKHFIRGYLDGDGNISKFTTFLVGTKNFLSTLNKKIKENLGVEFILYLGSPQDKVFKLRSPTKEIAKQFLNWIYQDSSIHLSRKFKKYEEMINFVSKNPPRLINEDGSFFTQEQKDIRNREKQKLKQREKRLTQLFNPVVENIC